MKPVLVDTSIWSLAFRKKDRTIENQQVIDYLAKLVLDLDAVLIGPVRQEILSGISDKRKFNELKEGLSILEDFPIKTEDYERAAEFYNNCRKHGVQGSQIDYLICAVAANNKFSIFTLDNDFINYRKHIRIDLEKVK